MINKRLLNISPNSKKPIMLSVLFQIFGLIATIMIAFNLGRIIEMAMHQENSMVPFGYLVLGIIIRFICTIQAGKYSNVAGHWIKQVLRKTIYQHITNKGVRYNEAIATSEVLQIAVEGVEQLEAYFENYLPQFFYAMLAPLVLFFVVLWINFKIAFTLLFCVPLIPLAIVFVQKFAKKLLNKYWGEYLTLGDHFLENLQGLTTLKIYQSDAHMHKLMDSQAERFRKITMRVLTMQLNSISVMDIMAYGSSVLGMVVTMFCLKDGAISATQAFIIILLCNEFFLPMRLLGSFFHIAMNGLSASKKMFTLFDSRNIEDGESDLNDHSIVIKNMSFKYDDQFGLKDISIESKGNELISIVGLSGSGKSTLTKLLMGQYVDYTGSICMGGSEVRTISKKNLFQACNFISMQSYLFEGTFRDNLLLVNPEATNEQMMHVLQKVRLDGFVNENQGLETIVQSRGVNLSGGQCQRLALARALLHDSSIYIFDEATSNIDSESETLILEVIMEMKKTKTILFITHKLDNVVHSDCIYVLEQGLLVESGKHDDLMVQDGVYASMYTNQMDIYKGGIL